MSDTARRLRSARQIWAAPGSRHDTVVAVLRFVLPAAIGVLAAFLVLSPLATGGDVSFLLAKNNVQVAKQRMKIETARYRGQDSKGRAFELDAHSAVQQSSATPVVDIDGLKAQIGLADGPATIDANQGRYDMRQEKVALDGPIKVRATNGYKLDTSDAVIDLKTRKLQSQGAVTGQTPQGSFSANHMSADLQNQSVSLDGNARLRIVPGRAK